MGAFLAVGRYDYHTKGEKGAGAKESGEFQTPQAGTDILNETKIVCSSMARQKNDGRGRMGGRQKGTPNKVTASVREWLAALIDKNRRQIEKDLKALEPKERLQVLERLMQYVVPKQQAMSAKVDFDKLTDEQLNEIVNELTGGVEDEATD